MIGRARVTCQVSTAPRPASSCMKRPSTCRTPRNRTWLAPSGERNENPLVLACTIGVELTAVFAVSSWISSRRSRILIRSSCAELAAVVAVSSSWISRRRSRILMRSSCCSRRFSRSASVCSSANATPLQSSIVVRLAQPRNRFIEIISREVCAVRCVRVAGRCGHRTFHATCNPRRRAVGKSVEAG